MKIVPIYTDYNTGHPWYYTVNKYRQTGEYAVVYIDSEEPTVYDLCDLDVKDNRFETIEEAIVVLEKLADRLNMWEVTQRGY